MDSTALFSSPYSRQPKPLLSSQELVFLKRALCVGHLAASFEIEEASSPFQIGAPATCIPLPTLQTSTNQPLFSSSSPEQTLTTGHVPTTLLENCARQTATSPLSPVLPFAPGFGWKSRNPSGSCPSNVRRLVARDRFTVCNFHAPPFGTIACKSKPVKSPTDSFLRLSSSPRAVTPFR